MATKRLKRPPGLSLDDALDWCLQRKTERVGDCLLWTGSKNSDGYGHIRFSGKLLKVHRLVLARKIGRELAPGEMACHHCDTPSCVEPTHLFAGDNAANIRDALAKGRLDASIAKAAASSAAARRLFDDETEQTIARDTRSQSAIAADYGCAQQTISRVKKLWPDIAHINPVGGQRKPVTQH